MSGTLKQWMYAVWKYESADYTWSNVGKQQSMTEIVQNLKHNLIYFWT